MAAGRLGKSGLHNSGVASLLFSSLLFSSLLFFFSSLLLSDAIYTMCQLVKSLTLSLLIKKIVGDETTTPDPGL